MEQETSLHGGDIYSQEILWDFSTNINPLGTPESVKEAVRQSAQYCTRYPDTQCRELRAAIAADYDTFGKQGRNSALGVDHILQGKHSALGVDHILCANGAADLIYQLAFALRPRYALLAAPSFSEYECALRACGCQVQRMVFGKEQHFAVDVNALTKEIQNLKRRGRKPEMMFLCNPNNPTGLLIKKAELELFAAFAEEENIRLVLDECFLDFVDEPEAYSLIPRLNHYPHLVIIKAFTKLYGMAGLRLGYGLSADVLLFASIRRIRQPWSVSVPAQMAGIAALKEKEYVKQAKAMIAQGRIQLTEGLNRLGFLVYPSRANYLFFQDQRKGAEGGGLYQVCRQKKLLLRSCEHFHGLDGSYYRICVKTNEENEHFLAVLSEVLAE